MNIPQVFDISLSVWAIIFSLIAIVVVRRTRILMRESRLLTISFICNILLQISDICLKSLHSDVSHHIFYMTSVLLCFSTIHFIVMYLERRLRIFEKEKARFFKRLCLSLLVIGFVLSIIVILYNIMHHYEISDNNYIYFMTIVLVFIIIFSYCLSLFSKFSRLDRQGYLLSAIGVFTGIGIEIASYSLFSGMIISIYLIINFIFYEINLSQLLIDKEKQLSDERIGLLKKQIAPHFIFNCLNMIKYQVRTDSENAIDTIDDFALFLRSSIDTLEEDEISIEKELDILDHYLQLEKSRFKDISYKIRYDNQTFMIPPFTIQMLVENAIKHGRQGQLLDIDITIKHNKIIIQDNGPGFDVDSIDYSQHTGIKNIRTRIETISHGEMLIHSKIGEGCQVILIIPSV